MACAATLKRSLEFDPVHSPSHSSSKRRRCMPIATSSPPVKFNRSYTSPFSGATEKLTTDKIAASIAHEVKRMQRRRQLQFPSTATQTCTFTPTSTPEKDDVPSCSSSLDHSPQVSQSLNNLFSSFPHTKKDVPLFTFRQVSLICERLVRDREEEVKEQYDKVLNCKLAEQYESFLKFNHDQLHRRFGKSEMSYVS